MMKKQPLGAALTAAALTFSLALPVSAASLSEAQVVQTVNALGVMLGDEKGDMHLDSPVTRAEFVTMAIKATPGGDRVGKASVSPYPDVPYTHWASGYVKAAADRGYVAGFTDGTFRPNQTIVLAEGESIVLKLLGYTAADFVGGYPAAQMNLAHSLELDQHLRASAAGDVLTRRDSMYLFYNLMTAGTKQGAPYLTTLGHRLTPTGEIDLVALINDQMEGPLVAADGWQSRVPFDLSTARVLRNGQAISLGQVRPLDVVYYSESMRTLWVYSDKVTGTIRSLSPSASAPTAVTVAGRTLPIETSSAAFDLSQLGAFHEGDVVTLLLGRDGGVAAVTDPADLSTEQVGVVTAVADRSYSDGHGGSYTQRTAVLLATDGRTYEYPCEKSVEAGDLLRASLDDNGGVTLASLPHSSAGGTFHTDRFDGRELTEDVEILDVSENSGLRVYPSRLEGVELGRGDVLYCGLNSDGQIEKLILDDVTGDLWQFGVLTDYERISMGPMHTVYNYTFDLGGMPGMLPGSSTGFPVEEGPIRLLGPVQAPDHMQRLTSAGSGYVSGNLFRSDSGSHTLADGCLVYQQEGKDYRLSTLARVRELGLELTGWYDRADSDGGRLRVIVAK